MDEKTYKFSIGGVDYEVRKMKGRQARMYMLRFAGLLAELVDTARSNGIDLLGLIGTNFAETLREDPNFLIDQLVKLLLALGKLSSGDFFLRFEGMLPALLGVPDEILAEEGDFVEVYSAAIGVLIFQVGSSFTREATEAMENFQMPTPSPVEQEMEAVIKDESTSISPEPQEI